MTQKIKVYCSFRTDTKIVSPPVQKLTPAKLSDRISRYLDCAKNNNFFLIQSDDQKQILDLVFHAAQNKIPPADIRIVDFSEINDDVFELSDLVYDGLHGRTSAQQFKLQLDKHYQNATIVILTHLEAASSDILNRLAVLAEILTGSDFKTVEIRVAALFDTDLSSALAVFIDDLFAINKPEFVETIFQAASEPKSECLNSAAFIRTGNLTIDDALQLLNKMHKSCLNDSEMSFLADLNLQTLNLKGNNHLYFSARLVELYLSAGLYQQAKNECEQMINAAINRNSEYWQVIAKICHSEIAIKQRNFAQAQQELISLRVIFKTSQYSALKLKYDLLKAAYSLEIYDFSAARHILEKVSTKAPQLNQDKYTIEAQIKLCYVFYRLKLNQKCSELLELLLQKVIGNAFNKYAAAVYGLQGIIDLASKKYREAMASFNNQLFFGRLLNQKLELGAAIKGLANLYLETGFLKSAEKYYRKHLYYALSTEDDYLISISFYNLAQISVDLGGFEEAVDFLKQHEQLALKLNHPRALADNYALLAKTYKIQQRYDEADLLYDLILKVSEQNNFAAQTTPYEKSELYLITGDYAKAEHWLSYAQSYYFEFNQNRPDLLFKITVLKIKLDSKIKNISKETAENKFIDLFEQDHTELQKALLYYELFMLNKNENYYKSAIELYTMLYQEMPKDEFNRKILDLKNEKKRNKCLKK